MEQGRVTPQERSGFKAKRLEPPGVRPTLESTAGAATSDLGSSSSLPSGPVRLVTLAALEESIYTVLGHGAYQRRFLLCCVVGTTVSLMHYLAYHIIGRPVDHWCQPPGELAHLSADDWKNMSIPKEDDGKFSQCTVYALSSMDTDLGNRTIEPCHQWSYDIADWGNSIVSRFDLVCGRRYLYDLSTVLPPLVYALLAPVAGYACDRMGRKPVTCMCGCLLFAAAIGCSAAANYPFFLINRILVLASAASTYLVTFILLYEVTSKQARWLYTLLHTAVAGTVAPPMMQLLGDAEPSWTNSHIILIAPLAVYVAMCFLLDESPAWLLATWKVSEAEAAVLAAAKLNGVDEEKARQGMHDVLVELNKLSVEEGTPLSAAEGIREAVGMRRRAVAAFISRFTASGMYFGLAISDTESRGLWQVVHVVLSAVSYTLVIWATNKWGVRDVLSVMLVVTCGCTVGRTATMYFGPHVAAAYAHAFMMVTVSCTISMVMCYAGYAFPTRIRSAGVSLCLSAAGVGALVGVSLSKVHIVRKGFVFNVFYGFMTILSAVLVQWLPEVFVEKRSEPRPAAMNPKERKLALQASLSPLEHRKGRRRHHEKKELTKTS
ncbi:hypothetical protein HPB50_019358 [Hyalomma asiaticum]|uniref:Uncharacterized protein n=1 Tax=Hyalomma asiaticum TaxID=266040 RepID=A0ACB7SGZ8_HYAAI|nr:hypothetical protein HPB50_019358 [Hyalomma asiaticum]